MLSVNHIGNTIFHLIYISIFVQKNIFRKRLYV